MKLFKEITFAACLSVLAFSTSWSAEAHEITIGNLTIEHPWMRRSPMGADVAAGFLTVHNSGTTDDRLVSATLENVPVVQIHDMKMEGDVMKMFELPDGIIIPAGGEAVLKPMAKHIMFMKMSSQPDEGMMVKGTLVFEKAGPVDVEFEVTAAMAADGHDMAPKGDDVMLITHVMMGQFNTPDNPLTVTPVSVAGDFAVAGWQQGDKGGRAFLQRVEGQWSIRLCSGDGLTQAKVLHEAGMDMAAAEAMAKQVAEAEAGLDQDTLKRFASFEGMVEIKGTGGHGATGHGTHKHGEGTAGEAQ
jgi:periplasmic copper chaperone A